MWHHLFSTKGYYQSSQCGCVRTIASKTQGELDGRLEDKPELQLPLSAMRATFCFSATNKNSLKLSACCRVQISLKPHCWRRMESSDPMPMVAISGGWCMHCVLFTIDHDWSHTFWVWLVFHPLFSVCPLLGTCLLTTYGHTLINQSLCYLVTHTSK